MEWGRVISSIFGDDMEGVWQEHSNVGAFLISQLDSVISYDPAQLRNDSPKLLLVIKRQLHEAMCQI